MGGGMYSGYYPSCGGTSSGGMVTSPQSAVSPYMSGFTFPSNYVTGSVGGLGSSSSGVPASSSVIIDGQSSVQTSIASPGYLPGFNAIKNSIQFPAGYVMGIPNTGSAYSPVSSNHIVIPVSHKWLPRSLPSCKPIDFLLSTARIQCKKQSYYLDDNTIIIIISIYYWLLLNQLCLHCTHIHLSCKLFVHLFLYDQHMYTLCFVCCVIITVHFCTRMPPFFLHILCYLIISLLCHHLELLLLYTFMN